jgi:hypothetical protein
VYIRYIWYIRCTVHTAFLAGKLPNIRSYKEIMYDSGQPYTCTEVSAGKNSIVFTKVIQFMCTVWPTLLTCAARESRFLNLCAMSICAMRCAARAWLKMQYTLIRAMPYYAPCLPIRVARMVIFTFVNPHIKCHTLRGEVCAKGAWFKCNTHLLAQWRTMHHVVLYS